MHLHATEIPPGRAGPEDPDNPYSAVPGGGDQEAADLIARGGALGIKGDTGGALRCFRMVLARFPDHYIANYNMGNGLRLVGRPRSGIKYLKRAIRVWPEYYQAYAGMGRLLLDMGEPERAIKYLNRALKMQPGYLLAREDRNEALRALGRRARR